MRSSQHLSVPMVVSDEVATALAAGDAVVALESNVITHGLRYPENAETARSVEDAVRAGGSVPATIGIEDGRLVIGMTDEDIERFASTPGIPKVSSRDMPVVLAEGAMGATTVASSLVAAHLAQIPFFASAGIGGVHRGAERSMDVSSDLIQFTRSKVAVVCAGAKSILDLRLTMEYLETHCVPVVSYRSDDFPAFYCVSSGIRADHRIDDETSSPARSRPIGRSATRARSSSRARSQRPTRSTAGTSMRRSPARSSRPSARACGAQRSRSTSCAPSTR
jgi:pseudouridine-5'-phosphate glycosidase